MDRRQPPSVWLAKLGKKITCSSVRIAPDEGSTTSTKKTTARKFFIPIASCCGREHPRAGGPRRKCHGQRSVCRAGGRLRPVHRASAKRKVSRCETAGPPRDSLSLLPRSPAGNRCSPLPGLESDRQ